MSRTAVFRVWLCRSLIIREIVYFPPLSIIWNGHHCAPTASNLSKVNSPSKLHKYTFLQLKKWYCLGPTIYSVIIPWGRGLPTVLAVFFYQRGSAKSITIIAGELNTNSKGKGCLSLRQSCEMSNLLHGANLPNQIVPQEKCVNRDTFSIWNE